MKKLTVNLKVLTSIMFLLMTLLVNTNSYADETYDDESQETSESFDTSSSDDESMTYDGGEEEDDSVGSEE